VIPEAIQLISLNSDHSS